LREGIELFIAYCVHYKAVLVWDKFVIYVSQT